MEQEIVNRVANSGLITINLEEYYPAGRRAVIDIADQLFQGLILKEKDFRGWMKEMDWSAYQDAYVAVYCSTDAIIPSWAFMLMSASLAPYAKKVVFGDASHLEQSLFQEAMSSIDPEEYRDQKIVIKGCGSIPVPEYAYVELTSRLAGVASSIMYGEPCSTVPIYKKPKK